MSELFSFTIRNFTGLFAKLPPKFFTNFAKNKFHKEFFERVHLLKFRVPSSSIRIKQWNFFECNMDSAESVANSAT